jgi:hypothetical protein
MGQKKNALAENSDWVRLGLAPDWVAAFTAVAARRASNLSQLYAQSLRKAYQSAGLAPPASLPWRTSWPAAFAGSIPKGAAMDCARAGLRDLHESLGLAADRLIKVGAVRRRGAHGRTRMRPFAPPLIEAPSSDSPAAAVTLAHEFGHGVQMLTAAGFSRKSPAFAPAEAAAQIAERAAYPHLRAQAGLAMAAQLREDLLAMLVRHPARAALETGGAQWPEAAAAFAPALDWGEAPPPARPSIPGALTAYGLSAALSWVAIDRLRQNSAMAERYAAWALSGPQAMVCDLAAILATELADPALYESAYDAADSAMAGPIP